MNTHNDTTTALPAPFTTQLPAFDTKEAYVQFVTAWKAVYRRLSAMIRVDKLEHRRRDLDTPHQRHLAVRLAAVQEALLEHNAATELTRALTGAAGSFPCWSITPENTENPKTRSRVVTGDAAIANWMLWLRRAAKAQVRDRPKAQ